MKFKLGGLATQSLIREGLLAEYRFDERSGTTLFDRSGNSHNGTLGGTTNGTNPTWNDTGLIFDGVGNCVALPVSLANLWPTVRTLQIWTSNTVPTGLNFGKYRSWFSTNVEQYAFMQWAHEAQVAMQGPGTIIGRTFATDIYIGNVGLTLVYGSPTRLLYNGVEVSGYVKRNNDTPSATVPSNVLIGGLAGASSNVINNGVLGTYYYAAIYNRALSSAEIMNNHQTVKSIVSRRGVSFTNQLPQRGAIVCDGDSITLGSGSGTSQSWHIKLRALMATPYNYANYGISGQTVASINANAALKYAGVNSIGGVNPKVYILFAGTNDMSGAGGISTTTYNNIKSAAQAAKNAGYTYVVVASTMSRGGGFSGGQTLLGFESDRVAMNALLRADFPTSPATNVRTGASYADVMVDLGSDSNLGQPTSHSNATYFGDTIHPTAAGNDVIAGYMRTALLQLGLT